MPKVTPISKRRKRTLTDNVIAFARLLKDGGLDITPGKAVDTLRSLTFVDISRQQDFYTALKANLVSRYEDLRRFEVFYALFWQPFGGDEGEDSLLGRPTKSHDEEAVEEEEEGKESIETQVKQVLVAAGEDEEIAKEPEDRDEISKESDEDEWCPLYSPDDILVNKDFCSFTDDEIKKVRQIISQIAPEVAVYLTRRRRRDSKGDEIDLRRTFRLSLRHGGEVMQLARKKRKVKRYKTALLCDVSGSMDCYSSFLIQYMYSLQRELQNVETYVFSTRLTDITRVLQRSKFSDVLELLSDKVKDWSGGTSIGNSIHAFNTSLGGRRVGSKTIMLIISDGWDRGDTRLLEEEMALLKRRAYKVIWLNPLLGSASYQPLCKGMRTVLPYTDYFLPVHNIRSLIELGKILASL